MKLSKAILMFLTLFAAAQFCFGQEKPNAVLIDQFGKLDCDDLNGRLDNFLAALQDKPGSTGYVVIYSRENLKGPSLTYLNEFGGWVDFRKFDPGRISVIRAKKDTEFEMQLWKVPAGADKPIISGPQWPNVLPSSTKPFVFTSNNNRGICYFFSPKDYADFLNVNPGARGHLVVYEVTRKARGEEAQHWIKSLARYNIPRQRLRIFYVKSDRQFTGTEFWIVPAKKK